MSLITYNGPTGDSVENPSIDFIKDIIFNKNADYWKKGSGDSGIEIEGLDEQLVFFYDEPYGFFIMRHPDYLAPYDKEAKIEVIELKFPTSESELNLEKQYFDLQNNTRIVLSVVK
ncbi:MAG: hypothetical protein GX270_07535 [Clostridiaceae bacterium]|nr:hypothetical protein [Clostridiaceae bacterium]